MGTVWKMKILIIVALVFALASAKTINKFQHDFQERVKDITDSATIYAVLVAGSNTWSNYRHQADVSHAYQILRNNGVPQENIITMMYDDIANNRRNPTPGVIINEPKGKDVYGGVVIDYKGHDVSPDIFTKVLTGKATNAGTGKVLTSGPNDHVFINFVDHGAVGLLAFPNEYLYAEDLQKIFNEMYENGKYGKLVMYTEACEAGSMYDKHLTSSMNIYVTTAANAKESSYACYYDSHRDAYLGDVYSVKWMHDSEVNDLTQETLVEQYEATKKATTESHVMQYGDLEMGQLKVADFQGSGSKANKISTTHVPPELDAVPSGDVPLEILKRKLERADSLSEQVDIRLQITALEIKRQLLVDTLKRIALKATGDSLKTESIMSTKMGLPEFSCYRPLVETFSQRCFNISQNEYAFRQLFVLANLCKSSVEKEKILDAMELVCPDQSSIVGIF